MGQPYTRIINPVHDESGDYYVGRILEFDGCMTVGETLEETYASLTEAMEGWLEVKLEHGDPIPKPLSSDDYSGSYPLRMPPALHKRLAIEAKLQGMSLNQWAVYKLTNS